MKGKLFVMVGIPGSGKSTFAKRVAEAIDGVVLSSDDIRAEMFGDASHQCNPKIIFDEIEIRAKKALSEGKTVFLDSTGVKQFDRIRTVIRYHEDCSEAICVVVDTPVEECFRRNNHRERVVPEWVIDRMLTQYTEPTIKEGWDRIVHISDTMMKPKTFLKSVGM